MKQDGKWLMNCFGALVLIALMPDSQAQSGTTVMDEANAAQWEQAKKSVNQGSLKALQSAIEAIPVDARSKDSLSSLLHRVNVPWVTMRPQSSLESADIVNYLVNMGADINSRDKAGDTFLYYLSYHNTCGSDTDGNQSVSIPFTDIKVYPLEVHRQFVILVETVLKSGADPNLTHDRFREGETPLWAAVNRGDKTVVALLLEYGANPDPETGMSALDLATESDSTAMIELLSGN